MMKTAHEWIEEEIGDVHYNPNIGNSEIEYIMRMYAREACKEQREICAKEAKLGRTGIGISLDSIKNANEPELK